jgi:hypothetical protein
MPDILMKYGESLFDLAEYDMAQQVYTKITQDYPNSHFTLYAYLQGAVRHSSGTISRCGKWARTVVQKYPDSTKQVERARRLINSSRFKYAESTKERGEFVAAAQQFDDLANTSGDSVISSWRSWKRRCNMKKLATKTKPSTLAKNYTTAFPPRKWMSALFKAMLCEELGN